MSVRLLESPDRVEYITDHDTHLKLLKDTLKKAKKGTNVIIVSPTIRVIKINTVKQSLFRAFLFGTPVSVYTDISQTVKEEDICACNLLIRSGAKLVIVGTRTKRTNTVTGEDFIATRGIHSKHLIIYDKDDNDKNMLVTGSYNWLSAVDDEMKNNSNFETSVVHRGGSVSSVIERFFKELVQQKKNFYRTCGTFHAQCGNTNNFQEAINLFEAYEHEDNYRLLTLARLLKFTNFTDGDQVHKLSNILQGFIYERQTEEIVYFLSKLKHSSVTAIHATTPDFFQLISTSCSDVDQETLVCIAKKLMKGAKLMNELFMALTKEVKELLNTADIDELIDQWNSILTLLGFAEKLPKRLRTDKLLKKIIIRIDKENYNKLLKRSIHVVDYSEYCWYFYDEVLMTGQFNSNLYQEIIEILVNNGEIQAAENIFHRLIEDYQNKEYFSKAQKKYIRRLFE
jgi:predicted house-cleaning noncanonical NTP pyrophosphatase (MazG superfamily)